MVLRGAASHAPCHAKRNHAWHHRVLSSAHSRLQSHVFHWSSARQSIVHQRRPAILNATTALGQALDLFGRMHFVLPVALVIPCRSGTCRTPVVKHVQCLFISSQFWWFRGIPLQLSSVILRLFDEQSPLHMHSPQWHVRYPHRQAPTCSCAEHSAVLSFVIKVPPCS